MAFARLRPGDVDGVEWEKVSAPVRYTFVPDGADLLIDGKLPVFPVGVVVEAAVAVIAGGRIGRLQEQPVALALIESAVFAEQGRRVDIGLCKNGKAILS